MDILRAKEIIKSLAYVVDPLTREVLHLENSCNQAQLLQD